MTMDDSILKNCNETELLSLARRQGLGILKRGIPPEELVGLVSGVLAMRPEYLSGTKETRAMLETYIFKNYSVTRSQLPGCTGKCSTFNCTDGRHAICFTPNAGRVQ
jgi:hypothetical protein